VSALVLDTNAYSAFFRGDAGTTRVLRSAQEIHVPLFVLGELLAGFAAGTRAAKNREDLARFTASPRVHLLLPDAKTADHYADIYATLRRQGTPIPTNDLWIAAIARQRRMPLFSFDEHFGAVPGLALLRP
jgi:tRNA(fMet)-specific endonuclease VapC